MLIMLKMLIFVLFLVKIVLFTLKIIYIMNFICKLSDDKIKSLSLEDFASDVIAKIVMSYSINEIVSDPHVSIVCNSEFGNNYVMISSNNRISFDFCVDVVNYCSLYFGTTRYGLTVEGSSIHTGVVNYIFIFFK